MIFNYFDIIFFSPPYFKLELYRGKNQSTELYKNYDDWLSKYWEVTIQLCRKVLKKNGNMAYIIGDYDKNYIVKDMNNITKKYFTYKISSTSGILRCMIYVYIIHYISYTCICVCIYSHI